VDQAALVVAFGILLFLMFGLQECLETWQNGKTKAKQLELDIEREKTKQAELGNNKQTLA
jgi:hypothetical protein